MLTSAPSSWPSARQDQVDAALHTLANRWLIIPDQEELAFALVRWSPTSCDAEQPSRRGNQRYRLEERAYALIVENGSSGAIRSQCSIAWPTVAPPSAASWPGRSGWTVCEAWLLDPPGAGMNGCRSTQAEAGRGGRRSRRSRLAGLAAWAWPSCQRHSGAMLACADRAGGALAIAQAGAHEQGHAIACAVSATDSARITRPPSLPVATPLNYGAPCRLRAEI